MTRRDAVAYDDILTSQLHGHYMVKAVQFGGIVTLLVALRAASSSALACANKLHIDKVNAIRSLGSH